MGRIELIINAEQQTDGGALMRLVDFMGNHPQFGVSITDTNRLRVYRTGASRQL